MNATTVVAVDGKPKLLDRVRNALRVRHLARSTEKAYVYWCRRYILCHNKRHPLDMGKQEVEAFLTHLAVDQHVSASTQNKDCRLPQLDRRSAGLCFKKPSKSAPGRQPLGGNPKLLALSTIFPSQISYSSRPVVQTLRTVASPSLRGGRSRTLPGLLSPRQTSRKRGLLSAGTLQIGPNGAMIDDRFRPLGAAQQ